MLIEIDMDLPKAFSLRDENEFFPIQHLMARLNPEFMVVQVATGMHFNGGCTVFWGLVYLANQPISRTDMENALQEAGFDFTHGSIPTLDFLAGRPQEAREASHIAAPWS